MQNAKVKMQKGTLGDSDILHFALCTLHFAFCILRIYPAVA